MDKDKRIKELESLNAAQAAYITHLRGVNRIHLKRFEDEFTDLTKLIQKEKVGPPVK